MQTQFLLARRFDNRPLPGFAGTVRADDFGGHKLTDAVIRCRTRLGGPSVAVQNLFDKFSIDDNSDTRRATDDTRFHAGRGRVFTCGWDCRF